MSCAHEAGKEFFIRMIGILIITHSFLGRALVQVIEQIRGPQKYMRTIDINGTFDHQFKWEQFRTDLGALDQGEGVLIFTDLFGSASSNLAIAGMGAHNCEVIMGVNIPMLLTAIENRARYSLHDLVEHILVQGRFSIQTATSMLEDKDPCDDRNSLLARSLMMSTPPDHKGTNWV